ncbi:DJ-1-like protein B [Nymphaea thermarum]|nr:DJ-1-like protein B [Nymphaea thermarum]
MVVLSSPVPLLRYLNPSRSLSLQPSAPAFAASPFTLLPPFLRRRRTRRRLFFTMASLQKKVMVPIADGTEEMEAVIMIDVLRRAGADVAVASVEKELQVVASRGVKLVADAFVRDLSDTSFDLIALPGGMPGAANFHGCQALETIVKKHAADGRPYAAICASPAVVLDKWGLLDGLKATCHPSFMDKLSSAVPVDSRVQQDGKVVTSSGPGTAMEFALVLVEQLFGKEKRDEVAGPLLLYSDHNKEHPVRELNAAGWSYSGSPQVLVPVANGSEEMEAVIIIDVLRRAKANVIVASVEDKLEVVASRKVKLVADMLLKEAAELPYDLIVLPGKKATAYPTLCNKLSDQSDIENRVVIDGNLITSRGPGTTMEFALRIVEKFFGREKALELASPMVFTYV